MQNDSRIKRMKAKNSKGRLIVIDGTDGSGKTVQTALLIKRLREAKRDVAVADFPRYGLPSAYFVEQYLKGRYGSAADVDPHVASFFYALDRYDAKRELRRELRRGKIIVSNRYVTANMGHQGAKISSPIGRRRFYAWLDRLEHDLLGLPRPDLMVILHVPAALAQRLVDRKGRRDYIRRRRDLHEADLSHLQAAERTYLELAKRFTGFRLVECVERGRLLPPETIHEKIWNIIQATLPHR